MAQADEIDIARVDELTEEVKRKAAITVARYAASREEIPELLEMLGLLGDETPPGVCPICKGPMPAYAASPKCGMRGACSSACRDRRPEAKRARLSCLRCGARMARVAGDGVVRRGSRDLCERCYTGDRAKQQPRQCVSCGCEYSVLESGPEKCKQCSRGMISAARARRHLVALRDLQASWGDLASATGMSRGALGRIVSGATWRIWPKTERAILAVTGIGEARLG